MDPSIVYPSSYSILLFKGYDRGGFNGYVCGCMREEHSLAEPRYTKRGKVGANGTSCSYLFCAAFYLRLRAAGTWAGRTGRAHRGRRALHFRAARARAGRAVAALGLHIRARVNDNRLLLGDARFQHVVRQVRHRRALRLQHIVHQIRACRARRNARLEHIFRHVRHRGAHGGNVFVVRAGEGASAFGTGGFLFGSGGPRLTGIIVLETLATTSAEHQPHGHTPEEEC
jgi:hypothetical protein